MPRHEEPGPLVAFVAFVEGASTGCGLRLLAHAEATGARPVFLTTDPEKYAGAPGQEVLDVLAAEGRLIRCRTLDEAEVPPELTASGLLPGIAGIVCAADRFLSAGAAIAEACGAELFGVEAARVIRDKRRMRELLDRLGVADIAWADARSEEDARAFAARLGRPVVLKNVRGSGSQQVVYAATPADAAAACARLLAEERYLDGELMVEEFVDGPLVSLEGIVAGGRFTALGVTDREFGALPHFVELGWTHPAPLPAGTVATMTDTVQRIADALGIRGGPLHVEFMLGQDGPVLVDFNARLPGGLIVPMLQDVYEGGYYDLVLAGATGRPVRPAPAPAGYGAIRKVFPTAEGVLDALEGLDRAAAAPGVREVTGVAAPGTPVAPPRDYRGSLFHLRGSGTSAAGARQALLDAAAAVTVRLR
ncbi:ATP-grasp domain-containing protein [Streptomyces sp. NPDC035033]|uniref:ATP-grasp domain-containing protein n=1 Tax=Streptomyces sp. NPDC035033 TaxID=3155368 RepID=UPI0033C07EFD